MSRKRHSVYVFFNHIFESRNNAALGKETVEFIRDKDQYPIMKIEHRIPLAGLIGSTIICLLLIHYFLADFVATILEMDRLAAYQAELVFLIALQFWRGVMILKNKDPVTSLIESRKKQMERET